MDALVADEEKLIQDTERLQADLHESAQAVNALRDRLIPTDLQGEIVVSENADHPIECSLTCASMWCPFQQKMRICILTLRRKLFKILKCTAKSD